MVYIKLEEKMDEFMNNKYDKVPKTMKKIIYNIRYKNGKYIRKKVENSDYIILPNLNKKTLKNLEKLSNILCWKNICVSENLLGNDNFKEFANNNLLKLMDGNWLLKNIVDKIVEYIIELKQENLSNQEICVLCNKLDTTIIEKIKELALKVKICNIITNNSNQYQKLESELYQNNGILLNILNNNKRSVGKSSIIINFDFSQEEFEKYIFNKNAYIININNRIKINKKENNWKNITSFEINMPQKYKEYKNIFKDFNSKDLYESFIYKHTNYNNTKKELLDDKIEILYLEDYNKRILKSSNANLSKTLDKIRI